MDDEYKQDLRRGSSPSAIDYLIFTSIYEEDFVIQQGYVLCLLRFALCNIIFVRDRYVIVFAIKNRYGLVIASSRNKNYRNKVVLTIFDV